MKRCSRCKQLVNITIMSMFNREIICMDCHEKERAHPKYKEAMQVEMESVRRGEINFPGIGKPHDL